MAATHPARLTPSAGRRFAWSVGGALLIIAGAAWWRGSAASARGLGALGAVLLVAGAVVPGRLSGVYRMWMAAGGALSKLTTPIVLSVVYFCVVTPMGLLLRLSGRRPLRHRLRDNSYWSRVPSGGRSRLENQF